MIGLCCLLNCVSVAGCLGYDVLGNDMRLTKKRGEGFSCWLFRL